MIVSTVAPMRHNTVSPTGSSAWAMIAVSETTSRPADYRRVELVQRVNDAAPDAINIGNRRLLTDPDAVVDTRSNVFNELAMQMGLNSRDWLLEVDHNGCSEHVTS